MSNTVHNLYHSHLTATARLMNLFSLAIFLWLIYFVAADCTVMPSSFSPLSLSLESSQTLKALSAEETKVNDKYSVG
jgi:hypothetical protein